MEVVDWMEEVSKDNALKCPYSKENLPVGSWRFSTPKGSNCSWHGFVAIIIYNVGFGGQYNLISPIQINGVAL